MTPLQPLIDKTFALEMAVRSLVGKLIEAGVEEGAEHYAREACKNLNIVRDFITTTQTFRGEEKYRPPTFRPDS